MRVATSSLRDSSAAASASRSVGKAGQRTVSTMPGAQSTPSTTRKTNALHESLPVGRRVVARASSRFLKSPNDSATMAGGPTATCSDESAGILGGGLAAVFSTGYGDGTYPVDVTYNSEGRVVAVTILFDEDPNEDKDCGHCGNVVDPDEIYDGLCAECQTIGDHDNDEED